MKKLLATICLTIVAVNLHAQENKKIESIIIGNGVIRTQDSRDIVARFYANEAEDTVTINMNEFIPVKKALPQIAQKLRLKKGKTTFLKLIEPDNTVVYQSLDILAPDRKAVNADIYKSPVSLGYSIGRHTDQYNVRFRLDKGYGIDIHYGTSLYRGDVNAQFFYLGLSNEVNSILGSNWAGVFSAGAIGLTFYQNDEMILGPVGIIKFERPFTKTSLFGPKFIFGAHNEIGFAISTRF